MSTINLPATTLKQLDRISRDFLWGTTTEKKKQHLISWDRVCRPRREGGLGIHKAGDMNAALISKVGWRVLKDYTSLWAKVVRSKYKVGDIHDASWMIAKGTWSSTWRNVGVGLRGVVVKGARWVIGDGRRINFWTDKWVRNEALCDTAVGNISGELMVAKASELWVDGVGWNLSRILPYVTEETRMELAAIVVDNVTGATDRLAWGEMEDGRFSVSSAYQLITREESPGLNLSKLYGRIWKVKVPERIRVFLWLVGNQVLMSNQERFRRHISDTEVCSICKSGIESIIHILRDCPTMQGIWNRIVPERKKQVFFSQSVLEWVYANLEEGVETREGSWDVIFAIAVWWAWKWRCGNIFGDNRLWKDRVHFIKEKAKEVVGANLKEAESRGRVSRMDKYIGWSPPTSDWIKLNTDGASRGNPGIATAGGVLRDSSSEWRGGFVVNLGRCSAPQAELWGVYYGLYLA